MHFIKNNALIIVYAITQLSMLLFAQFHDEILGEVDVLYASVMHSMSVLMVIIGYIVTKGNVLPTKKLPTRFLSCHNSVFFSNNSASKLYLLTLIGLVTSIMTVAIFISPIEYIQMLSSGDNSILMLREETGKGGISGIFKMFNYAPLGVYMATSSFLFFLNFDTRSKQRMQKVERFSLVAVCLKVLFSLDRLTIMAIFVVQSYKLLFGNNKRWKTYLIIIIGLAAGNWVSSIRMSNDGGIFGLLVTYCKLSLANFQLLLNKQELFSYTGTSSFLHPFMFVFRFIDIELKEVPIADYIWNSAQYLNAYLYMDFSFFMLFVQFLIGCFISVIESRRRAFDFIYIGGYFFYIFVIVSFITVPFIRAMEFWFVLLLIYFSAHLLKIQIDNHSK